MGISAKLVVFVLILSLTGSVMEIWGGSWDITSHLLGAPESFFTPPHAVLYLGVGISLVASVAASLILLRGDGESYKRSGLSFGLKLIIIGSIIQIIAGPADYAWHEAFGTDGLLSPTHLTLITGILFQSVGIVLGLTKLVSYGFRVTKPACVVAFSALWFVVIAYIFQFTLPISKGEMLNLNPDPYVAGVILAVTMPFFSVLIFWGATKSAGGFGWASAVMGLLLFFNITANVIPSDALWNYLPWFVLPMTAAIAADGMLNKKINLGKFREEIAGGLMGAIFLVYGVPLIGMAYIQFYVFSGVSGYYLLPEFAETLLVILGVMCIPGAAMGIFAVLAAKKKIRIFVKTCV